MLREEYLRRLIDGAHIDLYLSANDGARIYWPWRMQPPKEANDTYRNACEVYVIDSDPLDNSVTNETVLDTAHRLDAEVASLQDVYQDADATVESLLRGLELYDDHPFDGELLLPLQDPYAWSWGELGEPTNHWLGIGGLKDSTPKHRLNATRSLRNAAGTDVHIHGFGWGVNGMAAEIRADPDLLDSVDYSSPMQNAATSNATSGEEIMSVAAMQAATTLVRDLREVSTYPDQEDTTQVPLL